MNKTSFRLYLKHLFRSIGQHPTQPLLLILLIMVSVSVCRVVYDIREYFLTETYEKSIEANGSADILIRCVQTDDRFLFADATKKFLPEGTEVCGLFDLPFYGEDKTFFYGAMCDLSTLGIFPIDVSESVPFFDKDRKEGVFVTRSVLEQYGYQVGDYISFDIMGEEKQLKIFGTSEKKWLSRYDILVDSTAVSWTFFDNSFYFHAVPEQYPCTSVYIASNGKKQECLDIATRLYPSTQVSDIGWNKEKIDLDIKFMVPLIEFAAFFASTLVIYCAFNILCRKRKEENSYFDAVGSPKNVLQAFGFLEMFLYWIVGASLGTGFTVLVEKIMLKSVGFTHCTVTNYPIGIIIAFFVTFFASESSVIGQFFYEILKNKFKTKKAEPKKERFFKNFLLAMTGVAIVLFIVTFCMPVSLKMPTSFLGLIVLFLLSFLYTDGICEKSSQVFSRKIRKNVPLGYAVKNVYANKTFHHFAGLFSSFLLLLAMPGILLLNTVDQMEICTCFLDGKYFVTGLTEEGRADLSLSAGESVNGFWMADGVRLDDREMLVFACDSVSVFNERIRPERLPEGDEIILNKTFADFFDYDEGEVVRLSLNGKERTFTVAGFIKTTYRMCLVDADYIGIEYDYALVGGTEENYETLLEKMSGNGFVLPSDFFFDLYLQENNYYLFFLYFLITFFASFALIGLVDVILSFYRERKKEFSRFRELGMNKCDICLLKQGEMWYSIITGLLGFCIMIGFISIMLYEMYLALEVDLFYLFL